MVSDDSRGQAYTLEGFIGAIVILTAVLFALQSVVIMPTTSGKVSKDVQEQLRTEATDVLTIAAGEDELSCQTRYWNDTTSEATFASAVDDRIGYGPEPPDSVANCTSGPTQFGEMLNQTFGEQGREYNIIVSYRNASDPTKTHEERMVYRGVPTESAVTATYTVTLYDDQRLLGPSCGTSCPTLGTAYANDYFPIPDAAGPNNPVYNVVTITVIIW
ncbi:DUF7288 family protein [Haloarchaeobius sp. DFWS5]|uniref:DUF7288 family protein n=1 Tax=Haloarchaeobius sp. DFWS5 TaxID=3446114 RepID=UPI003EBCF39F